MKLTPFHPVRAFFLYIAEAPIQLFLVPFGHWQRVVAVERCPNIFKELQALLDRKLLQFF